MALDLDAERKLLKFSIMDGHLKIEQLIPTPEQLDHAKIVEKAREFKR